jgi:hypothetical protein
MREAVSAVLNADGSPVLPEPPEGDMVDLIALLRGHLQVLIREVDAAARELPETITRFCALACVGEARGKLRARPAARPGAEIAYARRLARVLTALCDHHERIGGKPT